MLGTAVGMGAYGLRPIVEIQFADYIYPATDQLISAAARLRYRSGGEFWAPTTVPAPYGGGIFGGQTNSQSVEAIFTHVCGLKTVIPSNPYDAKGLLISAIEDDDPVIFLEPKRLYNGPFDGHPDRPVTPWAEHPAGEVPDGHYRVPLGQASVVRPGEAVTVLTYGTMVHVAMAATAESGIEAEVVGWHVAVGATVAEDDPLVDVMTDKVTVEIPSPRAGRVLAITGAPGDKIRVGAELLVLEVDGDGEAAPQEKASSRGAATPRAAAPAVPVPAPTAAVKAVQATEPSPRETPHPQPTRSTRAPGAKPLASPAVRRRAHELGIPLQFIPGTGPGGRIGHADVDAYVASGGRAGGAARAGLAP